MTGSHQPPDHAHLETRLLVLVEILGRAVQECRRALDEVRRNNPPTDPDTDAPEEC